MVLLGLFLALKLHLYLWYRSNGVDVLGDVLPTWRVFLLGPDLLAVAGVTSAVWALSGLARWVRFKPLVWILSELLPFLAFGGAALVACVSFRVNQTLGRPLDFGILDFASSLGALRDSLNAYVDFPFVTYLSVGLALIVLAPRMVGPRPAWPSPRVLLVGLLILGVGSGACAYRLFRHVYASGLKTNPLLELARTYQGRREKQDNSAVLARLEASFPGSDGAALDTVPASGPGAAAGRPDLAGRAAGQNLLLVVLESTSAEYLDAKTAPTLTRLASQGLSFERHFTTAPWTFTAQYSLYYSNHLPFSGFIPREAYGRPPVDSSLFEVFQVAGYRTGVFCSAFLYFADLGWLFQGKGVDVLQGGEQLMRGGGPTTSWGVAEPQTEAAVAEWITQTSDRPFFAVYNPVTPHHPYHAPTSHRPFPGVDVVSNYRNAIAYEDQQVAALLAQLDRAGLSAKTVVAVVSDHGESVGTPHGSGHGLEFSLAEVHVPFTLYAPATIPSGREQLPTNHLDVAPTLASLFGLSAPVSWSGRNLLEKKVALTKLFVGLGAGNHVGLIDNGVAFERDLNDGSFHAHRIQPGRFEPAQLSSSEEARYRQEVGALEERILLRHLRLALRSASPGRAPSEQKEAANH
jgi:hypothetical protein